MMKNIKYYSICILLYTFHCLNAQDRIDSLNVCRFSIIHEKDTIQFIKINNDLETPKPTILFCQGSLAIPLIIKSAEGRLSISMIDNFDYKKISETYNIIVISSPHVPLIVDESQLNHQYAYITDKNNEHSYPQAYLDVNYLEKYVERGNAVIDFLLRQKWVDKNHIIVVGHSQGAKVAAKITAENNHIAALGFFSGNPMGRAEQYVRQSRLSELKGILSPEEAQAEINKTYSWWKWQCDHINEPSQHGEDSPRTTISFSTPILPDLLKIIIPIYIAYGTKDIGSSYCDLLPIDFIRAGKTNYNLVPYLGLEHNYFEVDPTGKPDYDKCHWVQVMNDFVDWLNKINNLNQQ
ncbi:MAG: hypothetical protein FWF54_07670 [Candidatus Azobacteroides sp.]|nr:hypothetical protein [Candidatus Azobacteroides sp.]